MNVLAVLFAQKSQGNPLGSLLLFLPLIVLFYFMLIRPQKRARQHQTELMKALELGDEVETVGGIFGRISRMDDDHFWLEIAPGTTVKASRGAVRRKVYAEEDEQPSGS